VRYFLKRTLGIARYFATWRGGVAAAAFVFTLLAIVFQGWAALYLTVAALASLVLIGTIGTRVNETYRELQTISDRVDDALELASTNAPRELSPAQSPTSVADETDHEESPVKPPITKSRKPDVSVIVTAFNERAYVADCLESIRRQSWENFECIVVDDESTDDTLEIAFDGFSQDSRFRFVTIRRNSGLSAARNVGMESARADWVTFVDGDDYLYEEALERRLRTLAPHQANHWVAGVYCSWAPVPQDEPLRRAGEDRPARKRISWLDALHDAPFIASAPIVRAKIIPALGGFRNVDAAEDADMWTKVLRHGYVFLPTKYTGIAYRQKANSMFRRETVEHASVTVGLHKSNYEPKPEREFAVGTPFHYTMAAPEYVLAAESFRRNLIALTTAVAQKDRSAITQFVDMLELEDRPYLPWVTDIDQIILQAARRSESYATEGADVRTEMLVSNTKAILEEKLAPLRSLPVPDALHPVAPLPVPDWARLRDHQLVNMHSRELETVLSGHIVMTPSAAYHIDELGPLATELSKRGTRVAFLVSDRRWDWTEAGLRSWDFPVYSFPDDYEWTRSVAGLVTLNDWGEEPHAAIVAANSHGVPTFAKVEGVQDFNDVDVPRIRNPYRTAAHVLCQGRNDERALAGRADTHIVGNSRLESIWARPGRRPVSDLIVVNLNFTWGVLEEARDLWVKTVVGAIKELEWPSVFSLHPAEKSRPEGVEISDLPMRHLLTQASVLISRFSTVPFEAMARGVPFVYHNPHNEAVPTFQEPRGAFEITRSTDELVAAIELSRSWIGSYRKRSEAFFRNQIDIDSSAASAERSAEIITRLANRS
jgi:glycosyltransferase involved in cell wall biosynthesis